MIKRKVEQLDGVIDETEKNYTSNTMDRVFGNIKVPFFGVRGLSFTHQITFPPVSNGFFFCHSCRKSSKNLSR